MTSNSPPTSTFASFAARLTLMKVSRQNFVAYFSTGLLDSNQNLYVCARKAQSLIF